MPCSGTVKDHGECRSVGGAERDAAAGHGGGVQHLRGALPPPPLLNTIVESSVAVPPLQTGCCLVPRPPWAHFDKANTPMTT